MKIDDNVDQYVYRSFGAAFGRGDNGNMGFDVGA